jgi:hypothetical protein
MTVSTPPVSDGPEWHPVHRANALLREALQNTTQSFASLEARYSVESLSNAIESVLQGPVRITYPTPLAVRPDGWAVEEGRSCLRRLRPLHQAPALRRRIAVMTASGTLSNKTTPGRPAPDVTKPST